MLYQLVSEIVGAKGKSIAKVEQMYLDYISGGSELVTKAQWGKSRFSANKWEKLKIKVVAFPKTGYMQK